MPRVLHLPGCRIDLRPQRPLGTLQEIAAVLLQMDTKEIVSQQTLQQFPTPGTGAVNFPGGPGNVPEMHHGEIRYTLAEESRAERQVVILEQDNRGLCATLLSDHGGEGRMSALTVVPMARLKYGPLQLEVA